MKVVLQSEITECGLACIAMVCSFHGRSESLTELRRRFPVSMVGTSLKTLMTVSDVIGFTSRAVRCDLDELVKLETPCILHWDMEHYVVLKKSGRGQIDILDPARGARRLTISEVSKHFTGVALELTPSHKFVRKSTKEKISLRDLWHSMPGLPMVLSQLFLLTLLLQTFGILMPIANQIVIDDVIGRGDRDMLVAVILGFGMVAAIQTIIGLLRSFISLHIGQKLSIGLAGNLLKHILRLPTDFFERRHVGDIQSRFGSLGPIQDFLTSGVINGIMDSIMVVPYCIIMVLYSPLLSLLVVGDIASVLIVELAAFGRNKRLSDEALTLNAKTQSIFLETLRAVRTIKLGSREPERHAIWQNAMTEQQNMTFKQGVFNLWGSSGFSLLMAGQGLAMLYFGATEIMAGHLSLGMFMAFQSYAGQFSSRTKSLIGQFVSLRMLDLHLERLADIVLSDEESSLENESGIITPIHGKIDARCISFRYSPQDSWILKDASLSVNPGERVVLIGPSGGGKSTLLKILTGLYEPGDGQVLIDGIPLKAHGAKSFREQIGVVMQDDQILSGTVADNVAFFDAQIDMEQVEAVCRLTLIHDDIIKLPMGYNSLVGDMGSVFSGGQKQRILLARALYRRPKILFMDEGTANLDSALEAQIFKNLQELAITQIMVAHRPAAIEYADRPLRVHNCAVYEADLSEMHFEVA